MTARELQGQLIWLAFLPVGEATGTSVLKIRAAYPRAADSLAAAEKIPRVISALASFARRS